MNPETSYSKFSDLYGSLFNKNFPVESKQPKKLEPRKTWIMLGLIKLCYTKSKLYKKFKTNPSIANEYNYKKCRNKLKSLMVLAERTYYANRLNSCGGNLKQVWEILNTLLNKEKKALIEFDFNIKGQTCNGPHNYCKHF